MNKNAIAARPRVVLAFSGGLDTSFCAVWLKSELGCDVVTATVDTGGFSAAELKEIAARAKALGAVEHRVLDGKKEVFTRFVSYLVKGNVLRGRAYPLCVAAERIVQAELIAKLCAQLGASGVAHGSTGAGNDQFRFDGIFRALIPSARLHTPIRDLGWSREKEAEYLAQRGVKISPKTAAYSVNAGLWGTTVGGKETHDPWAEVPEEAFPGSEGVLPKGTKSVVIGFERGLPVSLDGSKKDGVPLIEALNALGRQYRLGRGIHIGDTVLGIKGRIAFEAPAPLLLIAAHRELEKLTLTRWQSFWKDQLGEFYGQLLHEGLYLDPVMRDIEAMIESSQLTVTGEARLRLCAGKFEVTGVRSPHSIMEAKAKYGETTSLWSGGDAAGFAKLHALPMTLAQAVRGKIR